MAYTPDSRVQRRLNRVLKFHGWSSLNVLVLPVLAVQAVEVAAVVEDREVVALKPRAVAEPGVAAVCWQRAVSGLTLPLTPHSPSSVPHLLEQRLHLFPPIASRPSWISFATQPLVLAHLWQTGIVLEGLGPEQMMHSTKMLWLENRKRLGYLCMGPTSS
ncbi:hypothetical protein GAH_02072 [Geoglobus ahangari]|uniref:Uncharacterized protein n=1 Tax=Geoglobus ahangari TaxID=113653 RepID=A0A0F7IDK5_9EURY|nr:hypothetical protein GAH_02072 [Geoglobus ahangari]